MPDSSKSPDGVVEYYDSRPIYLTWFNVCLLACVVLVLASLNGGGPFGMIGALPFGLSALYSFPRLVSRRVRLAISEEGILEQNFWYSPGFLPWDQVLAVRRRMWGLIEVEIRDPDSLLGKQPLLRKLGMRWLRLRGYGLVVITPWGLEGEGSEIVGTLQDGLEEFNLAAVRHAKALQGESSDPP